MARETLLRIAEEAEHAEWSCEQQAEFAKHMAAFGYGLDHASGTIFFIGEYQDALKRQKLASTIKLEALNRERSIRWGGV